MADIRFMLGILCLFGQLKLLERREGLLIALQGLLKLPHGKPSRPLMAELGQGISSPIQGQNTAYPPGIFETTKIGGGGLFILIQGGVCCPLLEHDLPWVQGVTYRPGIEVHGLCKTALGIRPVTGAQPVLCLLRTTEQQGEGTKAKSRLPRQGQHGFSLGMGLAPHSLLDIRT